MRMILCSALFGLAVLGVAHAQDSNLSCRIIDLSSYSDTEQSWYPRNTYSATYATTGSWCSGLQFRLDLSAEAWHTCPFGWNHDDWTNFSVSSTNTVLLPETWHWLEESPGLYLRAVCSSSPNGLTETITTNRIVFTNDSLSTVSNVWLGLWGNGGIEGVISVTSLPPASASGPYDYVLADPASQALSINWGWFQGGYTRNGFERELTLNWKYSGPSLYVRQIRFTTASYEIE